MRNYPLKPLLYIVSKVKTLNIFEINVSPVYIPAAAGIWAGKLVSCGSYKRRRYSSIEFCSASPLPSPLQRLVWFVGSSKKYAVVFVGKNRRTVYRKSFDRKNIR